MGSRFSEKIDVAIGMSHIKTMNRADVFLWITCFSFLIPMAVNLGHWDGKPIDVVLSDIWLPFFLCGGLAGFMFDNFKIARPKKRAFLIFLPVLYYSLVGVYGGLMDGGVSNLFSLMRFLKQFAFLFAGWCLFGIYGRVLLAYFMKTCLIFFLVVVVSSIYYGDFPMGCGVEGRWGGCLLYFDIYGFPNSAASYYVLLLGLLMCCASSFQKYRNIIVATIPVVSVMIFLTLSRAAWVYLGWISFFGWLFLVDKTKKIRVLLWGMCVLGLMAFFLSQYENTELGFNALGKIERNISADPSSGRFAIWKESIMLIIERPFFGYGFSYFSNYVHGFGTPHNQYLEILFKAGAIGLLGYVFFLGLMWHFVKMQKKNLGADGTAFLCWGVFGGLIVNGIFQPIFSYSIIANLFMTSLGFLAAAAWSQSDLIESSNVYAKEE